MPTPPNVVDAMLSIAQAEAAALDEDFDSPISQAYTIGLVGSPFSRSRYPWKSSIGSIPAVGEKEEVSRHHRRSWIAVQDRTVTSDRFCSVSPP